MKKVTRFGGIFFKCKDPKAMNEWYKDHLGLASADDGGILFEWRDLVHPDKKVISYWHHFKTLPNILSLPKKKEGVTVVGEVEKYEYGKFGWILKETRLNCGNHQFDILNFEC